MTKISDTQAVLLSSAAQRPDGSLLPLPTSLAAGTRIAKPLAGLVTRGLAEERATDVADAVHRTDGDLRFGLFVTPAGLAAIGIEPAPVDEPVPAADQPTPSPATDAPRQTKAAQVLALLAREEGATLAELIAATGWLPHTTRAALTGLRKKGHAIERGKRGDLTCHRIVAEG